MHDDMHTHKKSWLERLSDWLPSEPQNRQQLLAMLKEAGERNLLSADHLAMIEGILRVSDIQVREIMTPKANIVAVIDTQTIDEFLPTVLASSYSRFPVLSDKTGEVLGVLLLKEMVRALHCHRQTKASELMRQMIFIPQSKRLDSLLQEFRKSRSHMAIVLNEHNHLAGLITIEDILEQIVGDIEDEYDLDSGEYIKQHDDNSYTVNALISVEDFNHYFNCNLATDKCDTIGGVILQAFGYLPQRGETTVLDNFNITVTRSDQRRIYAVNVTTL